jgi:hypothetical protein
MRRERADDYGFRSDAAQLAGIIREGDDFGLADVV